MEAHVGKDILGHYVENLEEFKNATGEEDKKRIKSEEFNKWIACLLIANSGQLKYTSLVNGMASQYSMKNNQYPKDIISSSDIMKKCRYEDSGMGKTEQKTSKNENLKNNKKVERKKIEQHKKNTKQVLYSKVN